jgi:hypothetical protein
MMTQKPVRIEERKLILAEGVDAYYFWIWSYKEWNYQGIQVLDFGGITSLRQYLDVLTDSEGFDSVESLVIMRDAEGNPYSAVDSIRDSLTQFGLAAPRQAFAYDGQSPNVAYVIFPATADANGNVSLRPGTLEDLCLETVREDIIMPCVDQYVACLEQVAGALKTRHKSQLHAFLAGKSDYVGMKLGEAARAQAWNFAHPVFEIYRRVLEEM